MNKDTIISQLVNRVIKLEGISFNDISISINKYNDLSVIDKIILLEKFVRLCMHRKLLLRHAPYENCESINNIVYIHEPTFNQMKLDYELYYNSEFVKPTSLIL